MSIALENVAELTATGDLTMGAADTIDGSNAKITTSTTTKLGSWTAGNTVEVEIGGDTTFLGDGDIGGGVSVSGSGHKVAVQGDITIPGGSLQNLDLSVDGSVTLTATTTLTDTPISGSGTFETDSTSYDFQSSITVGTLVLNGDACMLHIFPNCAAMARSNDPNTSD